MLIKNDDDTFTGGPLDLLAIFSDPKTGRFYAGFLEEKPMPGQAYWEGGNKAVRLKSKMHHTVGSDTIDGAREELANLAKKIHLPEEHVWTDPTIVFDATDYATVIVLAVDDSSGKPTLVKPK